MPMIPAGKRRMLVNPGVVSVLPGTLAQFVDQPAVTGDTR
jgi:hypothetical protein